MVIWRLLPYLYWWEMEIHGNILCNYQGGRYHTCIQSSINIFQYINSLGGGLGIKAILLSCSICWKAQSSAFKQLDANTHWKSLNNCTKQIKPLNMYYIYKENQNKSHPLTLDRNNSNQSKVSTKTSKPISPCNNLKRNPQKRPHTVRLGSSCIGHWPWDGPNGQFGDFGTPLKDPHQAKTSKGTPKKTIKEGWQKVPEAITKIIDAFENLCIVIGPEMGLKAFSIFVPSWNVSRFRWCGFVFWYPFKNGFDWIGLGCAGSGDKQLRSSWMRL